MCGTFDLGGCRVIWGSFGAPVFIFLFIFFFKITCNSNTAGRRVKWTEI